MKASMLPLDDGTCTVCVPATASADNVTVPDVDPRKVRLSKRMLGKIVENDGTPVPLVIRRPLLTDGMFPRTPPLSKSSPLVVPARTPVVPTEIDVAIADGAESGSTLIT